MKNPTDNPICFITSSQKESQYLRTHIKGIKKQIKSFSFSKTDFLFNEKEFYSQYELLEKTDPTSTLKKNRKHSGLFNFSYYEGFMDSVPVKLIHTGLGTQNAYEKTSFLVQSFDFSVVILFGCAGTLSSQVQIGDWVLAHSINGQELNSSKLGSSWQDLLLRQLQEKNKPIHKGDFFSDGKPVDNLKQKERIDLAQTYMAVDCESLGCFQACQQRKVPLVVLKVATDRCGVNAFKQCQSHWSLWVRPRSYELIQAVLKVMSKE